MSRKKFSLYGRVSILPKHRMGIGGASAGLLVISLAMLALAYIRTKTKGRGGEVLAWLRRSPALAGRLQAEQRST